MQRNIINQYLMIRTPTKKFYLQHIVAIAWSGLLENCQESLRIAEIGSLPLLPILQIWLPIGIIHAFSPLVST